MRIAKVTWMDACVFEGLFAAKKHPPQRVSIGEVVRDDEEAISLCYLRDMFVIDSVSGDDDESEGIVIPKVMVIKVEEL